MAVLGTLLVTDTTILPDNDDTVWHIGGYTTETVAFACYIHDTVYLSAPHDENTTSGDYDITDMPSDFLSVSTLTYDIRAGTGIVGGDTYTASVQIVNSSGTAFTDSVQLFSTTTTISPQTQYTGSFTITSAGLSGSKADWDSAKIRFTQTWAKDKGGDNSSIAINYVTLNGTYTQNIPHGNDEVVAYRFREDTAGVSWLQNENTAHSLANTGGPHTIRIRYQFENSGGVGSQDDLHVINSTCFEYRINTGSWTNIVMTIGAGTVAPADSPNVTSALGIATDNTKRLTTSTLTFDEGYICEYNTGFTGISITHDGNTCLEIEGVFTITTSSLSGGDTIEIRPKYSTDTITYTQTPLINITGGSSISDSYTMTSNLSHTPTNILAADKTETFTMSLDSQITKQLHALSNIDYTVSLDKTLANYKAMEANITYASELTKVITGLKSKEEALSFSIDIAKNISNINDAVSSVLFAIDIAKNLQNVKTTLESISYNTDLAYTPTTGTTITDSAIFGVTLAKTVDSTAALYSAVNIDMALNQIQDVIKLYSESVSFSLTLLHDPWTTGVGIFDDPVYSISSGEYYFVDLSNILAQSGSIKTGSVTFTNNLGQTTTIGLTAEVLISFITQLAQQQLIQKVTNESIIYNNILEKLLASQKDTTESIVYNSILDQQLISQKDISDSIIYAKILSEQLTSKKDISDSIVFGKILSQQENVNRIIEGLIVYNKLLDQQIFNQKIANESVTYNKVLDQQLANQKDTSESVPLSIDLSYLPSTVTSITGSAIFGINIAKTVDKTALLYSSINISSILDQTEDVYKLYSESVSFSLTLLHDPWTTGVGIFDDPVHSISNSEYYFIDLSNVLTQAGSIKAAAIVFTNSFGQSTTVGLTADVLVSFISQLIEQQNAQKDTNETVTYSKILDQQLINQKDTNEALTYSKILDQQLINQKDTNEAVTYSKILDQQLINQKDTNVSIVYSDILELQNIVSKTTSDSIVFTKQLEQTHFNQLVKPVNISFDSVKSQSIQIQADIQKAINFLTNLTQAQLGDSSGAVLGSISFNMGLVHSPEVKGLLNSAILFINNFSSVEDKQLVINKTLTLLNQHELQVQNTLDLVETLSFIINLTQAQVGDTTGAILGAITFAIENSYQVDPQIDYNVLLSLILSLADEVDNVAIRPAALSFNSQLDTNFNAVLSKVATIVFANTLDQVTNIQVDYNAAINLAANLLYQVIGETAGIKEALITFGIIADTQELSLKQTVADITLDTLLDFTKNIAWFENISLDVSFGQNQEYTTSLNEFVQFNAFFNKILGTQVDYYPSIDFDLQLADVPTSVKNTVSNILLQMDNAMSQQGAKITDALVNYGIQNDIDTTLTFTARGEITLSTQLLESGIPQLLGEKGVTFGHLLGFAGLANLDLLESITLSNIVDVSYNGFVIDFTIVTPDGRTLKIRLEDRSVTIDDEGREIKIYRSRSDSNIY